MIVVRQVGDLVFSPTGLAKSGLLVRHLAMPDMVGRRNPITDTTFRHFSSVYVNLRLRREKKF